MAEIALPRLTHTGKNLLRAQIAELEPDFFRVQVTSIRTNEHASWWKRLWNRHLFRVEGVRAEMQLCKYTTAPDFKVIARFDVGEIYDHGAKHIALPIHFSIDVRG